MRKKMKERKRRKEDKKTWRISLFHDIGF